MEGKFPLKAPGQPIRRISVVVVPVTEMGEETEETGFYRSPVASMPSQRGAPPMASRLQSATPNPHFFLGSNDDQLERAQSRAARTAIIRRKSSALCPPPPSSSGRSGLFSREQIMELYHNCLRLASENVGLAWPQTLALFVSFPLSIRGRCSNPSSFSRFFAEDKPEEHMGAGPHRSSQ